MKTSFFALALLLHAAAFSQADSLRPPMHDPNVLPQLNVKGSKNEITPPLQDSLQLVYNLLIQYPTTVISVTSLYEKEKELKIAAHRSEAICKWLIEKGIAPERLITRVEKYSEQTDAKLKNRKAGNAFFEIESYGYFPRKRRS